MDYVTLIYPTEFRSRSRKAREQHIENFDCPPIWRAGKAFNSGQCLFRDIAELLPFVSSIGDVGDVLECERCVNRVRQDCRMGCASGAWLAPGDVVNGLGGLLCEKSCLSIRCGTNCTLGF